MLLSVNLNYFTTDACDAAFDEMPWLSVPRKFVFVGSLRTGWYIFVGNSKRV
jgi:hypothetical protein